jgi:hypothetical protein
MGIGWWGANYNAALMDTVPRYAVSSVAGLAGSAGVFSSVLLTWFTGYAADHHAYAVVIWGNCILFVFSVAASWILLRKPMEQ